MTGIGVKSTAPGLHTATRGSGRPVVILHGGGLDHRHMMDALEPVFGSTQGWRRLYIDLPGHGRSPADADISSQGEVLASVIAHCDALLPGERFAVIGESRGSYLGQGIASRCPDRLLGMMLVCAGGMSPDGRHRLPEHRTLVPLEASMDDLPEALHARVDRLVVQTPEIVEKIRQTKLPAAELADRAMAERIAGQFTFSFDPMSGPPFEKPVLILNGRQDAIAGYAEMAEALDHYPRATFAVLDRAGHSLSWEQPELFAALTRDWLRRMELPTAHQTGRNRDGCEPDSSPSEMSCGGGTMTENIQKNGGTGGRRLTFQILRSKRAWTCWRSFRGSRRSGPVRAIVPPWFERRKTP